jgi:hypothetical protein
MHRVYPRTAVSWTVFARGQIKVERYGLRHDPDKGAGCGTASMWMLSMVISPPSRSRIPAIIENRGGLAGAVRPEQPLDFAGSDAESNAIDRDPCPESLVEPFYDQCARGWF